MLDCDGAPARRTAVLGQHRILGRHDLECLGQALALVDERLQARRIAESRNDVPG